MTPVVGDDAVYYYRVNNKTEGVVLLHVDDFLALGSEVFFDKIIKNIKAKYNFSKIEKDLFRFCGMDIQVSTDGIILSQNDYTESIEEIPFDANEDNEKPLNKKEFKKYRGATGKLIWLNEQTRPDLSYDSLEMSYNNKSAKIKHIKEMNKIIKKAKSKPSSITFKHVDSFNNLKILAYTDASYLSIEDKTKSVAGKLLFLSNKEETRVCPLDWKSKTIIRVCHSAKDAETRAMDLVAHDAVFIAKAIYQIFTGERNGQLEVTLKTDSQSTIDSLHSTKQVEAKNLRSTIQCLKDLIATREIQRVDWVASEDCHADILTKRQEVLKLLTM